MRGQPAISIFGKSPESPGNYMREATLREYDNGSIPTWMALVATAQLVSDRYVDNSGGHATHVEPCDNPGTWGGAVGEKSYLIRYGVMSHVGRFPVLPTCDRSLERGQLVVIQTDRGLELGEVLIATDGQSA